MTVPKTHPRYLSLRTRDKIVKGVKEGITSLDGLIAHGRGEAFDYLLKEKTNTFAKKAINKAALTLVKAKHPIISVNGNVAALVPKEIIKLSKKIPARLEINIFHTSKKRELKIKRSLIKNGAKEVLMPGNGRIRYIDSNRKYCNKQGIERSDVVFVPLEDGDRCEALRKMGKIVITIDLNPMSRTAKKANITIVDNIVRTMPLLIERITYYKENNNKRLYYNNEEILNKAHSMITSSF